MSAAPDVAVETARDAGCWSERYWLGHCEGFQVVTSEGKLGIVEEVVFAPGSERPEAIVVRVASPDPHVLVVPVEEIDEISLRGERIVLRAARLLGAALAG